MTFARLAVGVAMVAALSMAAATAQIDSRMPEGPNRELVARTCGSCHALSNLFGTAGHTRAGWDEKIDDMVALGLRIIPQERVLILDYLAASFPP